MNIKCFFGHDFKVIKIWNYLDVSFSELGVPRYIIYYQCRRCGKIKQSCSYAGKLHMEDLIKENR